MIKRFALADILVFLLINITSLFVYLRIVISLLVFFIKWVYMIFSLDVILKRIICVHILAYIIILRKLVKIKAIIFKIWHVLFKILRLIYICALISELKLTLNRLKVIHFYLFLIPIFLSEPKICKNVLIYLNLLHILLRHIMKFLLRLRSTNFFRLIFPFCIFLTKEGSIS